MLPYVPETMDTIAGGTGWARRQALGAPSPDAIALKCRSRSSRRAVAFAPIDVGLRRQVMKHSWGMPGGGASRTMRACVRRVDVRKKRRPALVVPTALPTFDSDDRELVVVVIETPKGSRNKYAFDPEERIFELTKVLPAGMEFPYDFGFIPSTRGGDGDPLDALVLMDEPAFPGCRLACRPIGVIVCVERGTHSYTHVKHVDDLGSAFEKELEGFFINYHEFQGKRFRVLGMKGPAEARRVVQQCRKALGGAMA